MKTRASRRAMAVAAVGMLLVACAGPAPSATPNASPSPVPTEQPTPTPSPVPPMSFPLAVVTGLTNLKGNITLDELESLASGGQLVVPCGITIDQPSSLASGACVVADGIVAAIRADQATVALLPPGLVEPATRVLPIAGDGPFGLFGPDIFGDPQARALPYPVMGSAPGEGAGVLDPSWTTYDAAQTWTLTAIGSLCADRQAAYQAVTLGKGWDWVFNGGTAEYAGAPYLNPNPPPPISQFLVVKPVETGNEGVTSSISRRSDVALANHKCPILHDEDWAASLSGALSFSVPEAVLPRWESFLGVDAVYLPADHQSDRGAAGIQATVELLDEYGFPRTGLGLNLDEALEPAYVDVAGLKLAFVSWNEVPGPTHADADTAGVAWLTEANVNAAVGRARAAGADLVFCDPQWWGGSEYHSDLWASQITAVGWMDAAGCDQILGGGLHVAGGIFLREGANGVSVVHAGPGNYMYGQSWWQETQEGVIVEMTFRGATLVNIRLHPYVMAHGARPSLTDPQGDGHYVLERTWATGDIDY